MFFFQAQCLIVKCYWKSVHNDLGFLTFAFAYDRFPFPFPLFLRRPEQLLNNFRPRRRLPMEICAVLYSSPVAILAIAHVQEAILLSESILILLSHVRLDLQ